MSKKTREELAREQMLKAYRVQIQDEELLARMNKATYDKMNYFIEGTKLIPEYSRLIKEQEKLREDQIARADATIATALTPDPSQDPIPDLTPTSEPGSLEITDTTVELE